MMTSHENKELLPREPYDRDESAEIRAKSKFWSRRKQGDSKHFMQLPITYCNKFWVVTLDNQR